MKNNKTKSIIKEVFVLFSLFFFLFGQSQQLESYIQQAIENNPNIQAIDLKYKVAEEKVNEANQIPNTEFSAGYFISEPETRTGAQRARFSIRQMLPWFGTITAKENYANSMANVEYIDVVIAKRKLTLSVSQLYYNLYATKSKQKVIDKNIVLVQTYEKLALTSVEVGKASTVDVLRLQIRQNKLQARKEILTETYLEQQSALNKLLNKNGSTPIIVIDELPFPNEDIAYTVDALILNPELLKYDKLYESVTQSEILNQKERAPMFGMGLDYIPVSERPDLSFDENGKDIFMPMVSLSMPLFNKKHTSKSKQNELRQLEITARKENRRNVLETALTKAVSKRNQTRITYTAQTKNLIQAMNAEEILIKNYETGTIDFNDLLDVQELQLKIELNQIQSVTNYYLQSAIINYLTIIK